MHSDDYSYPGARRCGRNPAARRRNPALDIERDRVRAARRRVRRSEPLPDYLVPYSCTRRQRCAGPAPKRSREYGNSLEHIKPLPWTSLSPGVVVDARVPFDDGIRYKRRPAVVVDASKGRVLLFPVTTKVEQVARRPGRLLALARDAGLREPRSVILWRPVPVERADLLCIRGHLVGSDLEEFLVHTRAALRYPPYRG